MKRIMSFVLLASLPMAAQAVPVHVSLNPAAQVQPDAKGYFTLGSVAVLSGGDSALRKSLAAVEVGRAPLPGDVRNLTPGDLDLKLREAGYEPGRDAIVGGVSQAEITIAAAESSAAAVQETGSPSAAPIAAAPSPIVIHPGDPVTIQIVDSGMRITAAGTAQSAGAVGDTIHVYRPGCAMAFVATVLDSQNVSMEP